MFRTIVPTNAELLYSYVLSINVNNDNDDDYDDDDKRDVKLQETHQEMR